MESGADNCVLSRCPNRRSACWSDSQAFTLASADVITLLQREHVAFALFSEEWALRGTGDADAHLAAAARHRAAADALAAALNAHLWRQDLGSHVAYNVSERAPILAKT